MEGDPIIVWLPGVTPKVQSADILDHLLPEWAGGAAALRETLSHRKSSTVPAVFKSVASWLDSPTNLLCWHCNDSITGFVWFVPASMVVERNAVKSMKTFGGFCSFPCAAAHNRASGVDEATVADRERMLYRLVELKHGLPPGSLKIVYEAPNAHAELAEYGRGKRSRAEYKRIIQQKKQLTLDTSKNSASNSS